MSLTIHRELLYFQTGDIIIESVHVLGNQNHRDCILLVWGLFQFWGLGDFYFFFPLSPLPHSKHPKQSEGCATGLFFMARSRGGSWMSRGVTWSHGWVLRGADLAEIVLVRTGASRSRCLHTRPTVLSFVVRGTLRQETAKWNNSDAIWTICGQRPRSTMMS